jgi:transketolase
MGVFVNETITVIGSINLDVMVKTERMPERGETVAGDNLYFLPGGKGANQAVAIARLGKKVYFVAKKGKDFVPGVVMKNLNHPNINLDYLITDESLNTGVALVNTTGTKGNKVTLYTGANEFLTPEDIEKAEPAIKNSKVVVVCTEIPIPAVKKALEIARRHNIKTILNIGAAGTKNREQIKEVLQGIDILIMNEREGGYLTNRIISHMETGTLSGLELRKLGVNHVIITMGKEGTLLVNAHGATVFHRYGIEVKDTVGGGDAFMGAVAVAVADGKFVIDAIDYGNAAGALVTQKIGAQEGLATKEELDAFIAGKKKDGEGKVYKNYNDTIKMLEAKTNKMRVNIIKMLGCAGSGHLGGSLSAVDVIAALYLHVMKINPKKPKWEQRDRFVLSKGHAAPALYAALVEAGFIPEQHLWSLRKIGGRLSGHPDMTKTPGVDMTTGSLGQGLSVANGMAMASKLKGLDNRVYVLLGDGESQEGQVWEAAMTSYTRRLDNVCAILDYNGLQIDGSIGEVKAGLEPLVEKWKAFNWNVIEIDGHNHEAIIEAFEDAKSVKGIPSIIIARTIKGKGVSFMERKVEYHGVAPNEEERKKALKELGCFDDEG